MTIYRATIEVNDAACLHAARIMLLIKGYSKQNALQRLSRKVVSIHNHNTFVDATGEGGWGWDRTAWVVSDMSVKEVIPTRAEKKCITNREWEVCENCRYAAAYEANEIDNYYVPLSLIELSTDETLIVDTDSEGFGHVNLTCEGCGELPGERYRIYTITPAYGGMRVWTGSVLT